MFTPNLVFSMVNVLVTVSQLQTRATWKGGLIAGCCEWVQPTVGGANPWVGGLGLRAEAI